MQIKKVCALLACTTTTFLSGCGSILSGETIMYGPVIAPSATDAIQEETGENEPIVIGGDTIFNPEDDVVLVAYGVPLSNESLHPLTNTNSSTATDVTNDTDINTEPTDMVEVNDDTVIVDNTSEVSVSESTVYVYGTEDNTDIPENNLVMPVYGVELPSNDIGVSDRPMLVYGVPTPNEAPNIEINVYGSPSYFEGLENVEVDVYGVPSRYQPHKNIEVGVYGSPTNTYLA